MFSDFVFYRVRVLISFFSASDHHVRSEKRGSERETVVDGFKRFLQHRTFCKRFLWMDSDCGCGGIESGNDVGLQWFNGLRIRLVRGFICLNSSRFGGFSGGSA